MSNPALWATSTAPRANSKNIGSTASMVGASQTIAVVMPVSCTICGGMLRLRVDQGGELAEHHAAAHLDRADLGDRVGGRSVAGRRASAGGLEVHDDESGLAQRQFVAPSTASSSVGEAELRPLAA